MKNTFYYLSTCSTCKRILKDIGADIKHFELQNIKEQPITITQLEALKKLSGSYESLFSRRSQQFSILGLKDKQLTEDDYKNLILQEYTFLKRPVATLNGKIFIGNQAANIENLIAELQKTT